MTVHQLEVQPRDVTAGALGLLLDGPVPVTLADLRLQDGRGGALTLGVLGASHVVTATVPGDRLTEQVSCDAVAAGGSVLPRHHRSADYEMISTVETLPRAELDATADRLRALARDGAAWLCGSFPGSGSALTVMTGEALATGGWTWRTWHLYPDVTAGEVVTTRSRWTP